MEECAETTMTKGTEKKTSGKNYLKRGKCETIITIANAIRWKRRWPSEFDDVERPGLGGREMRQRSGHQLALREYHLEVLEVVCFRGSGKLG